MRIGSERGFATGVLFLVIGTGAAYIASTYDFRRGGQIGPGYFPFWIGVILVALGIVQLVLSLRSGADGDRLERWDLRVLFIIVGSVVAFALLLRPLGLVATIAAVVLISALADRQSRLVPTLVAAAVLGVLNTAIFIYGLRLPIRIWPAFFGS